MAFLEVGFAAVLKFALRFKLLKKFSINETEDSFVCGIFAYHSHQQLPSQTPEFR